MQIPSSPRITGYNDYQNNDESASRTKKFHYANNTPQKNKYQYGMFSRRFLPNRSNNSIYGQNPFQRSRVINPNTSSMTMGAGVLNSQQLFSEEMIFLLSDEQNNIRYFKEKIDSDRQKIDKEFQNMKIKLNHIVQDLKISFQAELDKAYLNFISKYRQFKVKMQELRDVRKALLDQNLSTDGSNQYLFHLNNSRNVSVSNRDLLNEIERDAMLFRNQKLFNQISELQKEKIQPAKRITEELIALGGIDKEYYKQSQTRDLIGHISGIFQREVQQVYGNILDNYVISTQKMIKIHFETKQENTMILNALNQDNKSVQDMNYSRNNYKSLDPKDLIKSGATYVNYLRNQHQAINYYVVNSPKKQNIVNKSPKKSERPQSHSIDHLKDGFKSNQKANKMEDRKISQYQRRERPTSDWKSDYDLSNVGYPEDKIQRQKRTLSKKGNPNFPLKRIAPEQQNFISQWVEDIKIKDINTINAFQSQDALLCCIFANKGRNIVTGGKDKTVRVYDSNSGKLVSVLQGHKASICSIANHEDFVTTGGDNGCSSLIVWQTRNWAIYSKIQAHTAALTSIVDLQDRQHLITGGYDRKIVIYNYRTSSIVQEIKNNSSPIACMSLTSDGCRLVSTGLDSSITVWKVINKVGKPVTLELEKTFTNSSLVCSLRCVALRPNLCVLGTKQGKIQLFNLNTGQSIKKLAVSGSSIIELVLFERQNKPEWPLVLSCSTKQKSMIITKIDTGINNFIDVKGKLNVDFGCGIGPKVIVSQTGQMAVLSQSVNAKEINLYKISIL